MDVSRGVYRLAQVIKWTGRVLTGLYILTLLITNKYPDGSLLPFIILAFVFLAITQGVAWILEGFSGE